MLEYGQLVYLQIPATDITTSAVFYEHVLGWRVGASGSDSAFEAPGLIGQWISPRVLASFTDPAGNLVGSVAHLGVDRTIRVLSRCGATRVPPTS